MTIDEIAKTVHSVFMLVDSSMGKTTPPYCAMSANEKIALKAGIKFRLDNPEAPDSEVYDAMEPSPCASDVEPMPDRVAYGKLPTDEAFKIKLLNAIVGSFPCTSTGGN